MRRAMPFPARHAGTMPDYAMVQNSSRPSYRVEEGRVGRLSLDYILTIMS